MLMNDEPPTIDETYSSACVTSDMRVPTHGGGASDRRVISDYILGAGMAKCRLGGPLMRLHSEFHSTARPKEPTPEQIEALSRTILIKVKKVDPKTRKEYIAEVPDLRAATKQAWDWYSRELESMMGRLKSLPDVRSQLAEVAKSMRIENPEVVASHVINYWLSQNCPVCTGRGETVVPDTPKLSGRACPRCHGLQRLPMPYGSQGRRLAVVLDESRSAWIGQMRKLASRFPHHR